MVEVVSGDAVNSDIFLVKRWCSESVKFKGVDGVGYFDLYFIIFRSLVLDEDGASKFMWMRVYLYHFSG